MQHVVHLSHLNKQPTSSPRWYSATIPYDKSSKRYNDIIYAIAYYIAKEMLPFSVVEKSGFKKLLSVVDPRYVVPGCKYFTKTAIPKMYSECRQAVEKELSTISYFATTTDIWTSRTCNPYISLSVHFIDGDWNLKSKCLETAYFPEDHTGEFIAQNLTDALISWALNESKQLCIFTDSGANIVRAASLNKWTRLQCFGHHLHSAIGQ